ncbi:15303_t:CDS:2 [Entrophospora sp. SA101]|nr:15303_t:CDS:2 [Entrophospora sp. SA101]
MGNGQKAQHKRERNQKANGAKNASSQLKVNEAARTVICQVCRNTFLCTIRAKARKIIALENYKKKQAKKQRVRLKHLITIYHNISNFINLENLDEKIEDIFDMQMDYIESGGGINANEARRRIESIKDALYGTSHGGKYPGLKMIENWAKENN